MDRTFDFLVQARNKPAFMAEIKACMAQEGKSQLATDVHMLDFCGSRKTVRITPLSENSPLRHKVMPREVSYEALGKMLDGDFEGIRKEDVRFIEESRIPHI